MGEMEIDKYTYSAHRLNSNFYMPAEPAVIVFFGPRGVGKTTAMLNLIPQFDYDTLSIFSTTLHQPKFQALIETVLEAETELGIDLSEKVMFNNDLSCIIDGSFIASRDPSQMNLVIVDDFAVSDSIKSSAFSQLIMNGRPANITCLISAQNFTIIPKPLRENITHMCFFKGICSNSSSRYSAYC